MPTPSPSTLPTSSPYYIGEVGTAITLCMGCSESTSPVGRRTTAIADANIGAPPGIDDDDGEDTIEYLEAHFVEALEQGDVLDALAWTMGTCLNGASPRLRTLQLERWLRRVSPALGRWRRRGAREPPDEGEAPFEPAPLQRERRVSRAPRRRRRPIGAGGRVLGRRRRASDAIIVHGAAYSRQPGEEAVE